MNIKLLSRLIFASVSFNFAWGFLWSNSSNAKIRDISLDAQYDERSRVLKDTETDRESFRAPHIVRRRTLKGTATHKGTREFDIVASNPQEGVTFSCSQAVDPANGQTIPATVAMIPQRQETINLIFWKSEHFAAWQPQSRCETVSPKFQTFYRDGRLRYLTHGTINGYPVICAVIDEDETCNGDNQLFQVKPNKDPQLVLRQLMDVVEGKVDESVIHQSTGDSEQLYISVDEFLDD